MNDALYGVPKSSMRSEVDRLTFISAAKSARAYVTTASKDLWLLCHLAGIDPDAFLYRMKKRLSTAPTPEELADMPWSERNSLFQVESKPAPAPPSKPAQKVKRLKHLRQGWRQVATYAGRKAKLYESNGEWLSLNQWSLRCGAAPQTLLRPCQT